MHHKIGKMLIQFFHVFQASQIHLDGQIIKLIQVMQSSNEFKIVDGYVITNIRLGRGSFGTVYRGYIQNEPEKLVAVKIMPIDKANQQKNFIKLLKRELEILPKLENPYIVKLYHASRTKNNFYMFLEYCDGGDLKELLKRRGNQLSEQEALTYFRHIVDGFKGIHQESVIHRDIKPANILIHKGCAKISDFGFARVVTDMDQVDHLTLLGTPLYMSPQILKGEQFSSKCDIWSLGMMLYEILYGVTPWSANSQQNLIRTIYERPLSFPATPVRSNEIKVLIRKLLEPEEQKRISWHELFIDPLVRQNPQVLQDTLSQIKNQADTLDQSVSFNKAYLDHYRVMDKAPNPEIQKIFQKQLPVAETPSVENSHQESESGSNSSSQTKQIQQVEKSQYNKIVELQDIQLTKNFLIQRIDSYLLFKRNVGIFVNVTTNQIYKLYQEKQVKFPLHLFYRIMFLLQKYQMILFQNLVDVMASKKPIGQGFTDEDWRLYKKSQEYFSTLYSIKNDMGYIKPYFNEIFSRAKNHLQEVLANNSSDISPSDRQEVNEFMMILNLDHLMLEDISFQQLYQKVITMTLKKFALEQQLQNRFLLITAIYLKICLNPFNTFSWQEYQPEFQAPKNEGDPPRCVKEFNQFYEKYETMEISVLGAEYQNMISAYV